MKKTSSIIATVTGVLLLAGWGPPSLADSNQSSYKTVTESELVNPDPNDWLMYRRRYRSWGYSPLKQIDAGNVGDLELAWTRTIGGASGAYEAVPIVNGDYMFVTTPKNTVLALNAKTGDLIWKYHYKLPQQLSKLHPANRGVALWGDNVYMATLDCKLVALDAKTGKEQWTAKNGDWRKFEYATLAPLAVKGKILMGCSGGETGVRGSVSAYNAKTGKREWRFWTVPKPGEPGGDTWPKGTYKHGGGPVWLTGSYDPETNTTYWGTGNPGPWVSDVRPGKNLYTNSVIALDVATGKLKGFYQTTPHGAWDWDGVQTPLLMTTEVNGKKTKVAVQTNRNGFIYRLSLKPDHLLDFVGATPYANNNVITSIDPETGKPTIDRSLAPGLTQAADFCPSAWGGKDWQATTYSPDTKLLYVPANVTMCGHMPKGKKEKYKEGGFYIGYPLSSILDSIRLPGNPDHIGQLQAWNISTGEKAWKHNFHGMLWGPLLSTGGNLVFGGGTVDRKFRAYNATTGKVLWTAPAPSGVEAPAASYSIDGTQYIAVLAGWGVDGIRVHDQIKKLRNTDVEMPQGGTVLVYKLKDK